MTTPLPADSLLLFTGDSITDSHHLESDFSPLGGYFTVTVTL